MSEESGAPRVVVTGPTGWIGTAMLDHLAAWLGGDWADRVTLFGSSARTLAAPDGAVLPVRPLASIGAADVDDAIVLHLAYLTKEKAELLGERAFTDANLAIDDHLLAAVHQGRPRGLFVASSGAAALAADGRDRHPYGLCKLRQEDRFIDWGARSGAPVLAARIFNLAGPHINKIGSYAISAFIDQARTVGRISISARAPVFRSYLHVNDLCALATGTLAAGRRHERPMDLCGGEIVEMADLAQAVADIVGGDLPIARDEIDLRRSSVYLGHFPDTRVLAMAIGRPLADLRRQIADTWSDMVGSGADRAPPGAGSA